VSLARLPAYPDSNLLRSSSLNGSLLSLNSRAVNNKSVSTLVDVTLDGCGTTVCRDELGEVELGSLDHLNLAGKDVLEREDTAALLLNGVANSLRVELENNLADVGLADLLLDDLDHLLADETDVTRLSIAAGGDLVGVALRESNGEDTKDVTIGGLDISVSLNHGEVLADKRAELVGGHVHTKEVGKALVALDLIDLELELAEGVDLLGALEVTEVSLDDTAKEVLTSSLLTSGLGGQGAADVRVLEELGCAKLVPFLAEERIDARLAEAGMNGTRVSGCGRWWDTGYIEMTRNQGALLARTHRKPQPKGCECESCDWVKSANCVTNAGRRAPRAQTAIAIDGRGCSARREAL